MGNSYWRYLRNKSHFLLIFIIVLLVAYHYGTYLVASGNNNINIGSIVVWKSDDSADFRLSKIESIKEEYGQENVTLAHSLQSSVDFQIHSIESTFLNNGVSISHPAYWQLIENIVLVKGNTWDMGSTEKVIVIDEATAEKYFDEYKVINQYLTIEGESWKVIGVVSNTSSRMAKYTSLSRTRDTINLNDFDTDVYIPLYFSDYMNEPSEEVEPASIVIDTGKWLSGKKEENKVLDLIAEGDNYVLMSDNSKHTVVGVAAASSFGLHTFRGYMFSLLIPFVLLLGTYSYKKYQQRDTIAVRVYTSEDSRMLQNLSVMDNQQQYIKNMNEIINIHNNNKDVTSLYVIEYNEIIVGMCLIKIEEVHQNIFLWQLQIDKNYQNLKVGRKALKMIINYIKSKSYTITTKTTVQNENARNFLEKSGFIIFSENEGTLNYKLQ